MPVTSLDASSAAGVAGASGAAGGAGASGVAGIAVGGSGGGGGGALPLQGGCTLGGFCASALRAKQKPASAAAAM